MPLTTPADSAAALARAVKGLEERAQARLEAANELQRLADRRGITGLVKEELLAGVRRMLNQELEFLKQAQELRKRAADPVQRGLI